MRFPQATPPPPHPITQQNEQHQRHFTHPHRQGWCGWYGRVNAAKALLEQGADARLEDNYGGKPAVWAAQNHGQHSPELYEVISAAEMRQEAEGRGPARAFNFDASIHGGVAFDFFTGRFDVSSHGGAAFDFNTGQGTVAGAEWADVVRRVASARRELRVEMAGMLEEGARVEAALLTATFGRHFGT